MAGNPIVRLLAIAALAASLIAGIRWSTQHPLPIHWDEANYINQAIVDHHLFASGGVVRLVKALLFEDPLRPPAYRAFVAPVTMAVTPTLPLLRAIALLVSLVAMALLWSAARTVSSPVSALLAVAVVFSMPGVFLSAVWYGTEFPLFLAMALLLHSLLRGSLPGVAVAVAIGCLAKATFFFMAGPAILAALLIDRRPRLIVAAALGALIAVPWWVYHAQDAIAYARYCAGGGRWAVPFYVLVRLREFALNATGPLALAALLLLLTGLRSVTGPARRAVIISLAAALPVLILAACSPVFVARHFAPAFLPLAIVMAVSASRWSRVAVALVLLQGVAFALFPARLLPRIEQIDWSVVRAALPKPRPAVSYLGLFPGISPTEIRYAWLRAGDDATVSWLWSADEKSIDWQRVMTAALASDAVLVVSPRDLPGMRGFQRLDNAHDAELIARLTASGAFATPQELTVGRERHHVVLFLPRDK